MRTNAHAAAGLDLPQKHIPEMGSTQHLCWRLGGALSVLGVLGKVCLPGKCVLGGPEDVDDLLPEVRHSLLLSILSINTLAVLSHSSRSKRQLASWPWQP